MSLCTADKLSLSFGSRIILDEVSFAIQPGQRIGLIGRNGSGKSSLLRVLAGENEADGGEVLFARGVRAGYLPQDILELPPGTLVQSVQSLVGDRDRLVADLQGVEAELEQSDDADEDLRLELSQRLADLHQALADFEERYGRHRAEEILTGLGFLPREFDRPVAELSGGWKMRAALGGLLLSAPDLLLLDEPTNHLDIPSLQWFDDFLRRSPRALLLVSHDRDFLNRQIRTVLSFEAEGLRTYPGNYDSYRVQRAEEERNLELRRVRQEAQRAETERFIERFRYKASKASQVQSRVKQLAREELVQVRESHKTVRFHFPRVARSGREVVRLVGLGKHFGDKVLYRNLEKTIERGERVAIIGKNGAGKTTLLKLIAAELRPDQGEVRLGHNVQMAYYAQHHTDLLDREKTALEEVAALVPDKPQNFVRGVLGSFLFSGDDVDKRIAVLSGGERARVALARLLVLPANLLLMDEPTNHLDLDSSERLVEALREYDGTLVFVSHNRSFINQLATQIWDVGGTDGGVASWTGNLDDYLYHLSQIEKPLGTAADGAERPAPRREETDRERRQREAREREVRAAQQRPLLAEIAALESGIASLEAEQKEIEAQLHDPALYNQFSRAQPLLARFQEIKVLLEERYHSWEDKQDQLARLGG